MLKQYTIEEAEQDLSAVVEEAEHGARVEVTRGGRPVAVILRLENAGESREGGFWPAYEEVRKEFELEALEIDPDEVFAGVRDKSPGRDSTW